MTPDAIRRVEQAAAAGKLTADSPKHIADWLNRESLKTYHPRILQLIDNEDWKQLDEYFWTSIPFGTGGRRGPMGELGAATINDRTIAESAHGMAVYLKSVQKQAEPGSAVIACDTRNHSEHFARITATTFAAHGLKVFLFESARSTPELSFAVRHLSCAIGVMISASHNPPADNGFKAYWSNGGQVIPPHDKGIIAEVQRADVIPTVDFAAAVADGRIRIIGDDVDRQYVNCVTQLSQSSQRDIPALFTPLHGVGETSVYAVIRAAGFKHVDIFEPQREPDGNFPNVPKHAPNPENLEVFDPAIAWIQQTQHPAALIMASDPDADRLGVMVRNSSGQFTPLSGNQVGALLTDYLLRKRKESGRFSSQDYVVETLVTTPLTKAIAESHGARAFAELLVGFKYIAQTMEEQGTEHFVFGTEESIGFLAGEYCRDKDASVAALFILELAAELKAAGRTLLDQLDDLYRRCGYYCEAQKSIYCEGPTGKSKIDNLMLTLRQNPPASFGSVQFTEVRDYKNGICSPIPPGTSRTMEGSPRGDLLIYRSASDAPIRVQIACRPSGTEPKIKFYFFCQADLPGGTDLIAAKTAGDHTMLEVQKELAAWAAGQL